MANTSFIGVRVDPALFEAAAANHGMTGASHSFLIRYALALMAGSDDARKAATMRRGPRGRTEASRP